MEPVALSAHGYRMSVVPSFGANIIGLDWTSREGRSIPILRACEANRLLPDTPSPVGCFPMAPFANRIDRGTFSLEDQTHILPINHPDENVAIHGLSRFAAFDMISRTASTLSLVQRYRGDVFAYDLSQECRIDPSGASVRLTIINRGKRMPFGLGLHPYFVREEAAQLQFCASAMSQAEERHLPARFIAAEYGPGFCTGAPLVGLDHFDAHYCGWEPRHAILQRPEAGIGVTLSAAGAFRNLHIYVPPGGDLVCMEPVSHVPNVHNSPIFAKFGDLTALEPGDRLSGSMHLSTSSLTP